MKRLIKTTTAIHKAQLMDCESFFNAYETHCHYEDVENIMDLNEGFVNLGFEGSDKMVYLLFIDGKFECASY